jgi:hypothetical protein
VVQGEIPLGVNAKVIYVNFEPPFHDHVGKYAVHEGLKGGWTITESEEHHSGFKKAERCDECTLPLVVFLDSDIIISPSDVEFSEQGGILHVIDEFWDER